MIIARIIGGLGNQMFQYAMARALAIRRRQPLLLDVRQFNDYALHNGFELQRVFGIQGQIASRSDVMRVAGWPAALLDGRLLSKRWMKWAIGSNIYRERSLSYDEGIESLPADCYVVGYWQSERYFQSCETQIRGEFQFRVEPAGRNLELIQAITSSRTAVSVHVRRGDYVTNPVTSAQHGVCSVDYYNRGMRFIEEKVEDPVYFVFSDDIDWARTALHFRCESHFISHNTGNESFNDMRLMSACQHHICANSSFSWWGAWLNPEPEKIVVAPREWFRNPAWSSVDHVPSHWIRL